MVQIGNAIHEFGKQPICILTYNEIQAKKLYEDIKYFTDKVVFFPKKEIVTYDYIAESKDLPYQRIETLNEMQTKKNLIVVTTIEAVIQKLPSKQTLYKNKIKLKVGESYSLVEIKKKLLKLGYTRCDLIEGRGQFSSRGGILDVSINENTGIRIEFWGDEVDSIRNFSITSQRSINTLEKTTIYPAHEYILEDNIEEICNRILKTTKNKSQKQIIEEDVEQIKAGNYISKIDKYFECFYKQSETILDYLNENYVIFLDEINKIKQREKNISIDNKNLIKALIEKDKIVPQSLEIFSNYQEIENQINNKQIVYITKLDTKLEINAIKYQFHYREVNYYKSEIESLFFDIKKSIEDKKQITLLVDSKEKAQIIK